MVTKSDFSIGIQDYTGIFITKSGKLYNICIEKIAGENGKANDGDLYTDILIDETGKKVYNKTGSLHVIDFSKGYGQLIYNNSKDCNNKSCK